jgi:signal transduction histidine kinase
MALARAARLVEDHGKLWNGDAQGWLRFEHDLVRLRGLCRKVRRVAQTTGLMASLAEGRPIALKRQPLAADRLVRLLIEVAQDNQMLLEPDRQIAVHVDRSVGDAAGLDEVAVDWNLLEQCVNNLVDNACKYAFARTSVDVGGGFDDAHRFHLSVRNRGIPLHAEDVPRARERGWRSDLAQAVRGEGSGIGLWIVDEVMRAHEGSLEIRPTMREWTEVRLVFPRSGRS